MTNEQPGAREAGEARVDAADAVAGLEMLLAEGPYGPLRRVLPLAPAVRMAGALAGRPLTVARRGAALAAELARIGLCRSTLAPPPRDQRYADPAWSGNPLLRRSVQAHIAARGVASDLIADAELDGTDDESVRSALDTLADALAPSNTPLNPVAWREALETGGASVVRGARRLITDLATPPRLPATVEPDAFEVGTDVAATPGAVVLRTPVFELIQYLPQTDEVRDLPLLVVPPMVTRYYLADLAPGRSIVEHLVRGGQQVFLLSWRNPGTQHATWDLDTYGRAVLEAMNACEHVARTDRMSMMAFGSGGTITAMLLAHLAEIGEQERVASLTFVASVLDHHEEAGTAGATLVPKARAAMAASQRTGYLDGRVLAEAHAWMRPADLVWPYWVHNYLGGQSPPASEVLFWLADTVRLPAGLHRDLVTIALDNPLVTPGASSMLGTAIDLSKVDRDAYVVAGITGRPSTWRSCYRTALLLGGTSRFVLGGSTASVVCPPGEATATFRVADTTPPEAERWLVGARAVAGSWWSDHLAWLNERSGPLRDAPPELGGRGMHAVAPAPGEYVLQR
jgi:polyhydroxyalkanoate synthase